MKDRTSEKKKKTKTGSKNNQDIPFMNTDMLQNPDFNGSTSLENSLEPNMNQNIQYIEPLHVEVPINKKAKRSNNDTTSVSYKSKQPG